MLSTFIFAAVFIGLLFAAFALWAMFLAIGVRWAKVPDVTYRRIAMITATVFLLQCVLNVFFLYAASTAESPSVLLSLIEVATAIAVPCVVIRTVLKTRFLRAMQAWLPTLVASAVCGS